MNILVGFDESDAAYAAVKLAKRHALAWNSRLEIVKVIHQQRKLTDMDIVNANRRLQQIVGEQFKPEKCDFKTRVIIAIESAGEELVKYARKYAFDEIIIGIGKKSRVGKFLFGSNAQYIILNATCPVVVVK